MTIEICAVGGYNEVGKNMTAVKVDEEVVIIDMGFYLPAILALEDEERLQGISYQRLKTIGGIPDDNAIKDWKNSVSAIVLGHCHLDHIGAVPYMASQYNAPIIGTPFTIQVLRAILRDEKSKIPNRLNPVAINRSIKISEKLKIELIGITHSTPQSSLVVLHTPEGIIVYANDFKLDNNPILGEKANYKRLRDLGKKGVVALVVESLYADRDSKTPSEAVARQMLKEVLLTPDNHGKAIFVTTFASHLARIKSIIEFGRHLKRKIVIIGRSMGRYITAAEDIKLVKFSKTCRIGSYKQEIKRILDEVEKKREKYIVICTGNQAEPHSILDRIVNKEFKFNFKPGDHVIFSCKTIPADMNIANRQALEAKLRNQRVRIFKDIHVSGHSSKEDLRDFINMLRPQKIIPAHGENKMKKAFSELAEEEGYDIQNDVIILNDGDKVVIK